LVAEGILFPEKIGTPTTARRQGESSTERNRIAHRCGGVPRTNGQKKRFENVRREFASAGECRSGVGSVKIKKKKKREK
jgi:hypothetical protein